jgi:hypothetical protein
MSSRRLLPAVGVLVLSAVVGATVVAHATTLPLTQARLTTHTVAATVPVSSCSLTSSADTYANSAFLSTGTNFGTATTLQVRSDVLGNKRTFVVFDLASCAIPAVARVLTSSLSLYLATAPTASRTYDLHRVSAGWTELGLTWSNQPATAASATASVTTGTTGGVTLPASVLADVSAFVAGTATNNGWQIKDRTEGGLSAREAQFSSREGATPPSLVIGYYP